MEELTKRQKLAVYLLTTGVFLTIFLIGIFLKALIYCIVLFAIFAIINTIMEFVGKKQHAPGIWKIPAFFCCWATSSFLMFLGIIVVKYGENAMPTWQTVTLGIIIMAFSTFSMAGVFYWNPRGRPQKHARIIHYVRGNHAGSTISPKLQAFEDFLREHEDKRLWIVYNYIFIQGAPYDEVGVMLGLGEGNAARVSELCDRIVMAFAAECLTF